MLVHINFAFCILEIFHNRCPKFVKNLTGSYKPITFYLLSFHFFFQQLVFYYSPDIHNSIIIIKKSNGQIQIHWKIY